MDKGDTGKGGGRYKVAHQLHPAKGCTKAVTGQRLGARQVRTMDKGGEHSMTVEKTVPVKVSA